VYYDYVKPTNGKPGIVGYQIDSVKVDFVLHQTTGVDTNRYEQTFSLKFLAKGADDGQADAEIVYRSGNPGYTTGKPYIIGENPNFTSAQKVEDGGFRIASTDHSGRCLRQSSLSAGEVYDHAGSVLVYGETAYLSCNRQFADVTALERYCKESFKYIHQQEML